MTKSGYSFLREMSKISIIGSAGRQGTHLRINTELYLHCVNIVLDQLQQFKGPVCLISGGAAFCDHIAVTLYLKGKVDNLHLYLPAQFSNDQYTGGKYADTSNYYHRLFSQQIGLNSLHQISLAIQKGAKYTVYQNFASRNRQVAENCQQLIALGWDTVPTGGTKQTISLCKKPVTYLQIPNLSQSFS